jgi:hypothetical protein
MLPLSSSTFSVCVSILLLPSASLLFCWPRPTPAIFLSVCFCPFTSWLFDYSILKFYWMWIKLPSPRQLKYKTLSVSNMNKKDAEKLCTRTGADSSSSSRKGQWDQSTEKKKGKKTPSLWTPLLSSFALQLRRKDFLMVLHRVQSLRINSFSRSHTSCHWCPLCSTPELLALLLRGSQKGMMTIYRMVV